MPNLALIEKRDEYREHPNLKTCKYRGFSPALATVYTDESEIWQVSVHSE